jgi:hypothetical protein
LFQLTKRLALLITFALLFSFLGGHTATIASAKVSKVPITNPKSHPQLKDYFVPLEDKYETTDNGVRVYFDRKDIGYAITSHVIAKKNGKTLWKKNFHGGVGLLAVEGNLIFLDEGNQNSSINGPSTLIVLNTQGKTVARAELNGSINMNGYEYIRSGDILYVVTDRSFERLQEGGTNPGKLYSRVTAISVKTGKVLWTKGVGLATQPPVLYKGKIYIIDHFNGLVSFDSKGTKAELIKDTTLQGKPYFSPKGQVYLASSDSNTYVESLRMYDAKFKLAWSKPYTGFFLELTFDQDLAILSTNEYIDVKTPIGYDFSGRMYTFNESGKLLWYFKHQGYNSMGTVVSGDNLFFISKIMNPTKEYFFKDAIVLFNNRIWGLNKRTGAIVYKTGWGSYYFPTYQFPIEGKVQKANVPIIEEASSTNKKSYYLLK